MFTLISNMYVVQRIILNTLLVSLPEEAFWIAFTLIFVGGFDYLEDKVEFKKIFYSWDFIRIIVPSLIVGTLSDILRYTGADINVISVVSIIAAFISVIIVSDALTDANALKQIGKIFIFLMLGFLVIFVSEFIYLPFVLYCTGRALSDINNDILLNFVAALPSRLIQYFILVFFIIRKRTFLRANFVKPILESKILMSISLFTVIFDVIFSVIMYRVICFNKILSSLTFPLQLVIIISTLVFPIVNISALLWSIYYERDSAINKQKTASDELKMAISEIKEHTDTEKCCHILPKLVNIEKVASALFENNYDE